MNMCRSGKHDKDEVGQDLSGRCNECRRITNRKFNRDRRRRNGEAVRPPDKCQSGKHPKTGPGPCAECAEAKRTRKLEAARERRKSAPKVPSGRTHVNPVPVDGWEDEFGPCPRPVRNRDWHDRVIVSRVLNGEPSGRPPYPLEWAEIFDRTTSTHNELAELTGIGWDAVRLRHQRHGARHG